MEKANIVCYKNEMNLVPMRSFTSVEMDLFFAICSQMREKGQKIISFTFDELKQLSDYKPTATSRFADDIESVYKKLLSLQFYHSNPDERVGFVLFTQYKISLKNQTVDISINPNFEYILNQISREFTKFELEEFTSLISGYSKTAYRILKQYRKTGYVIFDMTDFKELFCIPQSYKMSDLDKRIFNPITQELSSVFMNFRIEKIKARKGRRIEKIEFIFEPETDVKKNGIKTFRDEDGAFYEKHLMDFSSDEVNKEYPPYPNPIADRM